MGLAVAASGASAQLQVSVGYADNLRTTSPNFPSPWQGSPNTTFIGTNGPYDAGAVKLVNTSSTPVSVTGVTVDLHRGPGGASGPTYSLWGSFTVPANGQTVLTQTVGDPANLNTFNFDTSESPIVPCGSTPSPTDPRVPTVTVNTPTGSFTVADKTHVIDTGGVDIGSCFPPGGTVPNESHQFVPIGNRAGTFSCRASALNVALIGLDPTVANNADNPCVTASTTGLPLNIPGLVVANVLNASTTNNTPSTTPALGDSGSASASVADVTILNQLNVKAAISNASVTCQAAPGGGLRPVFAGSSSVLILSSGLPPMPITGPTTINLGLIQIYLNRRITTSTSLTQRAVEVDLLNMPLAILGESKADISGTPCST